MVFPRFHESLRSVVKTMSSGGNRLAENLRGAGVDTFTSS